MKAAPVYWNFIVGMMLAAGGIGMALGILADELYSFKGQDGDGWLAGLFFGLLTGLGYSLLMTRKNAEGKPMVLYCVAAGIGAGVLCSTLVHAVLMIGYQNTRFWGMGVGALFGITAGAFLGLCAGLFLKFAAKTTAAARDPEHALP